MLVSCAGNAKGLVVNDAGLHLHPTREDGRTRQPRSNGSVGNHEHFRLVRVFGEVAFLDPNGNKNNAAEEDREATDDAVAIGLGEELNGHVVRSVLTLLVDLPRKSRDAPTRRRAIFHPPPRPTIFSDEKTWCACRIR